MVVYLFRLFSHSTLVQTFHPDRCGGLSFIGRFSLRSFYLVAIIALDLSLLIVINVQQIHRDPFTEPSLMSLIISYVVLMPAGFFLPLFSASRQMRSAKQLAQTTISREIVKIDLGELISQQSLDRLTKLRQVYNLAELPLFPLDAITLIQFLILLFFSLSPLIFLVSLR